VSFILINSINYRSLRSHFASRARFCRLYLSLSCTCTDRCRPTRRTRLKQAYLPRYKCRHNGIIWIRRADLNFQARVTHAWLRIWIRICFIIHVIKVVAAFAFSCSRALASGNFWPERRPRRDGWYIKFMRARRWTLCLPFKSLPIIIARRIRDMGHPVSFLISIDIDALDKKQIQRWFIRNIRVSSKNSCRW